MFESMLMLSVLCACLAMLLPREQRKRTTQEISSIDLIIHGRNQWKD